MCVSVFLNGAHGSGSMAGVAQSHARRDNGSSEEALSVWLLLQGFASRLDPLTVGLRSGVHVGRHGTLSLQMLD